MAAPVRMDGIIKHSPAPSNFLSQELTTEERLLAAEMTVSKRYEYDRITGAQLKTALRDLGKSYGWFAKFYGVPRPRVLKWVNDREDIPPSVIGWLAMASMPGGIELVERAMEPRTSDLRSGAPEDSD